MDPPDFPQERPSPSPRRRLQIQGPRPTPLDVRKESYKIKKPPVAPQPPQRPPLPAQHRPPVIIYTVSPKVIHTTASDFMTLVQRLTGSSSSSASSSSSSSSSFAASMSSSSGAGALSPAARIATIEKAKSYESEKATTTAAISSEIMDQLLDIDASVDKGSSFPGILSPLPSSLPPISPNFFSPSLEVNPLSFLHDLSPGFHGNKNFMEGTFLSSPSAFLQTPMASPTPYFDLFNQYFDL